MPRDNLPASSLETRLRREIRGEVLFDAFQPRALCDRRLDLPDRAPWGGRAEEP
jgi:hypothetical protein